MKIIRTILQIIIISLLLAVVIPFIFYTEKYKVLDQSKFTNTEGFIALSYFGVDLYGNTKYISKETLEKQLTLLKDQGFETISQQQIIDFYQNGSPLPEKALFLSFEDGRNDSSIFAQPILEKLNYKATMFTYANKMDTSDTKFLKPKHLIDMTNSGFWELGTNGYRLTYINIFNSEGEYIGLRDENNVPDKTEIEYYNHYLMDYIRDEYMITTETIDDMKERIKNDYSLIKNIYTEEFGYIPKAYAIMHANTLYNHMDKHVEEANDTQIKDIFSLHFNMELDAYNHSQEDLYNLSRLQVAPYWPINHLLMKIQEDSNIPIQFHIGKKELANNWILENGVAEFDDNKVIVTSYPSEESKLTYHQAIPYNSEIQFTLKGNVVGNQSLYLKNTQNQNQLIINLKNNELSISETTETGENLLGEFPLDEIKWNEEDYAFNKATTYNYWDTQQGSRIDEEEYPSNIPNERQFNVTLLDNELIIVIDQKQTFTITFSEFKASEKLYLSFGGSAISQDTTHEQYKDTIYDAIISSVIIKRNDNVIFTTESNGINYSIDKVSEYFTNTVDFFIEIF
nr:polysaccharide deacetylase family protein [Lysinibacillus timonensis]